MSPKYLLSKSDEFEAGNIVVSDGNLSQQTIHTLLEICQAKDIPFFYEPTDIRKATKPLLSPHHSAMTYCSPNLNELKSMLLTLPGTPPELPSVTLDTIEVNAKDIALAARKLLIHYNLKVIITIALIVPYHLLILKYAILLVQWIKETLCPGFY